MVGSTIKVVATTESGNTFESDETEEVGVYDELEIISAEQTGKNKVQVTFSAPASADDKLEVTKAGNKVAFTDEFDDTTYLTKTLTFTNNLSTGTYTVTLTPADKDVDPSSVEFEAVSATKAATLEITSDYLVMKDTKFDEGYFFIKGYNGLGDENDGKGEEIKPLTGLTVNAAPSDSVSYDSATGKVTVKYKDPGYAVVQKVSVFAQYNAAGGQIITAQKTLDVTTIGYPSELEWGEIKKEGQKDPVEEISLAELGSNKYYVEINSVKDQYGNDLSAEDLNDLVSKKLLTVIPTAESPIYFGTNANPFSTKDGKVVVFLTPKKNGMPGDGQLIITGAGGAFDKTISIIDDAYIDVLEVQVPDLYENEWSVPFTFTAYDQNGKEINLYDFAPNDTMGGTVQKTLTFTDRNHQVGQVTKIEAESDGLWKVKKDTVNKTFEVTYKPAGKAKSMATFTILPAGLLGTDVKTVPIGGKGSSASIVAQGSAATITWGKNSNINSAVKFTDANGKLMDRIDAADRYPHFLGDAGARNIETNADIDDDDITDYYWTVSNTKLDTDSTEGGKKNVKALDAAANEWYDDDGKIDDNTNVTARDANGNPIYGAESAQGDLGIGMKNPTVSYYITLLGKKGAEYKVLDSKSFRFVYVPTSLNNVKYKVNDTSKMLLYAAPGSKDVEAIKVTCTNDAGETWEIPADSLTPAAPFTSDGANGVKGDIAAKIGKGTVAVKIYVTDFATGNQIAVDTVNIAYDDADPVAASTTYGLDTEYANNDGSVPEGANWSPEGRLELETSNKKQAVQTMIDGEFKITDATVWGDKFTASIKDQYGVPMADSTVKLDGFEVTDAMDCGGNFVITNGSQKIDLRVVAGGAGIDTNKSTVSATATKITATTASDFDNALVLAGADKATNYEITVNGSVSSTKLEIPENAKVTVPSGSTLSATAAATDIKGTIEINGILLTGDNTVSISGSLLLNEGAKWVHTGATPGSDITVTGSATGTGHFKKTGTAQITNNGTWEFGGLTTELAGNTNILGTGKFGGNVVVDKDAKLTFGAAQEVSANIVVEKDATLELGTNAVLQRGAVIDLSKGGTMDGVAHKIAAGATIEIKTVSGESKIYGNTKDEAVAITTDTYGAVTTVPSGVEVNTVKEPDMDYITTVLTTENSASNTPEKVKYDFDKYYDKTIGVTVSSVDTDYDVASDKDEKDNEVKSATVCTYSVTGRLAYNADTPAFGEDYHWAIGIKAPSATAVSAEYVGLGSNMKAGTTAPANGWVDVTSDTEVAVGFSKIPDSNSQSYFIIRYKLKDGTIVDHKYDISGLTFEAAPSGS